MYGSSPPALKTWNVCFLRTLLQPQKSWLVLDLVHNIFYKQNLIASDSPLVSINFPKNNNFTSSVTSVWFWQNNIIIIYYETRTLQKVSLSLKATVSLHYSLYVFTFFAINKTHSINHAFLWCPFHELCLLYSLWHLV